MPQDERIDRMLEDNDRLRRQTAALQEENERLRRQLDEVSGDRDRLRERLRTMTQAAARRLGAAGADSAMSSKLRDALRE